MSFLILLFCFFLLLQNLSVMFFLFYVFKYIFYVFFLCCKFCTNIGKIKSFMLFVWLYLTQIYIRRVEVVEYLFLNVDFFFFVFFWVIKNLLNTFNSHFTNLLLFLLLLFLSDSIHFIISL